jgi:hypothetical protein
MRLNERLRQNLDCAQRHYSNCLKNHVVMLKRDKRQLYGLKKDRYSDVTDKLLELHLTHDCLT